MRILALLLLAAALRGQAPTAPAAPPPAQVDGPGAAPERPLADRLLEAAEAYARSRAAVGSAPTGQWTFRPAGAPRLPNLAPGEVTFEATHLSKQEPSGRFFVAFRLTLDGRPAGQVRVDMDGAWSGSLLKARAALPRQTEVSEDQFEAVPFTGVLPPGALTALPAGHRTRGAMAAGHLLSRSDLEAIPVVVAGSPVRLELVSGPLSVTVDGVARTSGGPGEKVRVELTAAKRQVMAVATGPGQARRTWEAR